MNVKLLVLALCVYLAIWTNHGCAQEVTAIDPTGKWTWEQASFGGNMSRQELEIRLENGQIVGSLTSHFSNRPTRQMDISNAKLSGDKLSFDVVREFNGNAFTTSYECVIVGDELGGISSSEFGGQVREVDFAARREKPSAATATNPVADTATADSTQTSINLEGDPLLAPGRVPEPGPETDSPYRPLPILPGGIVVPLYPAESKELNLDRIREAEKYSMSRNSPGRIQSIVNIHNPSIEIHRADGSINTGTCVILAAGGGHRTLNVGTEAADFVPFFYNYGVNCVILRNRLRNDGYEAETDAVNDALQAIRMVRAHAEKWGIQKDRIGIIGFSAGAELSGPAAIQFEQFDKDHADETGALAGISSRPDFVGLLYPGPTPFTRDPETAVPRNAPPSFVATPGSGDQVHAKWAMDYFRAMLDVGIPNIELHVYGNGVHAGGLKDRQGAPLGTWQQRYIDWFRDLGFLTSPDQQTKAAADTAAFLATPQRRGRRNP
ncbi:MAG: alpha/beta hydrolase fold domain-containing protein [Planctomycetales bacterium]|nr:alpha/beta hydrolase fold domain-containing protein [Planctomycetales bacterium]